jgi:ferredoxin
MRIVVDEEECMGHRRCYSLAPSSLTAMRRATR